jgi:hypothetical protein
LDSLNCAGAGILKPITGRSQFQAHGIFNLDFMGMGISFKSEASMGKKTWTVQGSDQKVALPELIRSLPPDSQPTKWQPIAELSSPGYEIQICQGTGHGKVN